MSKTLIKNIENTNLLFCVMLAADFRDIAPTSRRAQ